VDAHTAFKVITFLMPSWTDVLVGLVWLLILVGGVVVVVRTAVASQRRQEQVTSLNPEGWYSDPAGRHELRYWDGRTWTRAVVDEGRPGIDAMS
jgi:hypothetical protein